MVRVQCICIHVKKATWQVRSRSASEEQHYGQKKYLDANCTGVCQNTSGLRRAYKKWLFSLFAYFPKGKLKALLMVLNFKSKRFLWDITFKLNIPNAGQITSDENEIVSNGYACRSFATFFMMFCQKCHLFILKYPKMHLYIGL